MRRGAWAVLLLLASPARAGEARRLQRVRVQAGETLAGVARAYLKEPGRLSELRAANPQVRPDPHAPLPAGDILIPLALVREELRAARLVKVRGRVLARLADSAGWMQVREGEQLFAGDALRTLAASRAWIELDEGPPIEVPPGSMMIVHRARASAAAGEAAQGRSLGSLSARVKVSAAPAAEIEGEAVAAHRVQASPEPNFASPAFDRVVELAERVDWRRRLGPGRWWIRRAPIDPLGAQGAFAPPEAMELSSP